MSNEKSLKGNSVTTNYIVESKINWQFTTAMRNMFSLQDCPIEKWYGRIMETLKRTQWILQYAGCFVLCWFVTVAFLSLQITLHVKNISAIIILITEGLAYYFSHLTLFQSQNLVIIYNTCSISAAMWHT